MNDYNTTVTILHGKHGNKPGAAKSEAAINAARRHGEAIATEQKFGAATNKHTDTTLNTTKLDCRLKNSGMNGFRLSLAKPS